MVQPTVSDGGFINSKGRVGADSLCYDTRNNPGGSLTPTDRPTD